MEYLGEFGLSEKDINDIYDTLEEETLSEYIVEEDRIKSILNLFKEKGIKEIKNILLYRPQIFYCSPKVVEEALNSQDGIIDKINEDIINFELIGL